MRTLHRLYHMARADFLERTRRYTFLVTLGLVVWMGYLSASGQLRLRVPPDYSGVINSAWVGATMTVTVSLLLGWVGFYLVKGSVARDYATRVGQIMATTPLSRPLYMLGKWLSNFIVLALMIIILMLAGVIMNLLFGTEGLDLWALTTPLLVIALPYVGLIAAFAVLFESVTWLRGGLGNVVYFFAFLFALIASGELMTTGGPGNEINPYFDFTGLQIIGDSISRAAQAVYPESAGGFAFSITDQQALRLFPWDGVAWTGDILLSRLFFVLVAGGVVMLSAAWFDRFNPSNALRTRNRKATPAPDPAPVAESLPPSNVHLTPLDHTGARFRLDALFVAELKLLLKGQRWWWYAVAVGLWIAQATSNVQTARILLILSWTWPILILGTLGCRESRYNTRQIVFSAPRPVIHQLPAVWGSAFILMALLGSGALVRFVTAGETTSLWGWLTGACFIPSLALAVGTLSGSSKAFEVLYVLWMYLLTQNIPALDFAGITPQSPWYLYAPLALALFGVAALARRRQVTAGTGLR